MFNNFKLDSKLIRELDFGILIASIMIMLYGILIIYTATGLRDAEKQFVWLILGLIAIYFILLVDYKIIENYVPIIYWISVLLLVYTEFKGVTINGATGWIKFGPVGFQPAELAKISITLMLAKKLDDMDCKINDVRNFLTLCVYAAIPMLLIVKQPDMGMTMVCFFTVLGIVFLAGLNIKIIIGGLMSLAVVIALVWNSPLMKNYWKNRLTLFLNPAADPLGGGRQLIQSMIAIGSGGVLGSGLSHGTSYSAQFVPEKQTDFIFAVLGEQWGFIGALLLLVLYGVFIYRAINIGKTSKDIFGRIVCGGIIASWLFSILQNIGMTIGIMPITGITLPLMSYGGSSALINFISIGLILNIGMRRKKINF